MLIFIGKETSRVAIYGSIQSLYEHESEHIKIKQSSMYKKNLDTEDYYDDKCFVLKREVIRSKNFKNKS